MTISKYQPSSTFGPFFNRDPGPRDWEFPRGYLWYCIDGLKRRTWACFERDQDSAQWVLLSEYVTTKAKAVTLTEKGPECA